MQYSACLDPRQLVVVADRCLSSLKTRHSIQTRHSMSNTTLDVLCDHALCDHAPVHSIGSYCVVTNINVQRPIASRVPLAIDSVLHTAFRPAVSSLVVLSLPSLLNLTLLCSFPLRPNRRNTTTPSPPQPSPPSSKRPCAACSRGTSSTASDGSWRRSRTLHFRSLRVSGVDALRTRTPTASHCGAGRGTTWCLHTTREPDWREALKTAFAVTNVPSKMNPC